MNALAALVDFFVNPWLLGGLALLAAPIIIHLLNKRRYQVIDWAAMDFLLEAVTQNRRRLRLEDLILLLLRMLLLGLIVLAVARPLLKALQGGREDERLVVLDDSFSMEWNDGTGALFERGRALAGSELQEAVGRGIPVKLWRGAAGGPIGEGGEAAAGERGPTASPPLAGDTPPERAEAARSLAGLRVLEPGDLPLDAGGLVRELGVRFSAEEAPRARAVVLVSDFRAGDWLEDGTASLRGDLRAAIKEVSGGGLLARLRWRLINVGRPDEENAAVTGVRVAADHPLVGVPARIVVEVRNFGARERRGVRGELEIGAAEPNLEGGPDPSESAAPGDARPAPSAPASSLAAGTSGAPVPGGAVFRPLWRIPLPAIDSIAPGKSASTSVEFTFDKPGMYPLLARFDADALGRDDVAFGAAKVRDGLQVVVVDGDPGSGGGGAAGGGRLLGESAFLLAALAPRGPVPSGITPRRVAGEIGARDLGGADVVLLLNRERLSAGERGLLDDFVRDGGGLGIFLGNRVAADRYAEAFAGGAGGLLPATLGVLRGGTRRSRLEVADWGHPAFGVFRGVEGSSLGQVGFDRFFALTPAPGASVVARYDDDEKTPAIVEMARGADGISGAGSSGGGGSGEAVSGDGGGADGAGAPAPAAGAAAPEGTRERGRTALFNLSADRDWNDWPTDPSYPIVLQEWVRHLAPRAGEIASLRPGETLSWRVEPGVRYDVVGPDGRPRPIEEAGAGRASFRDTGAAGFYCVRPALADSRAPVDAGSLRPLWFACNRSPRESDLRPVDEARLRAALADEGVEIETVGFGGGSSGERIASEAEADERGEAWRWCAFGAGLFLLVELLVAWWFGRR